MLSHHVLYLVLSIVYFTVCQSTIRIGIIDDNINSKETIKIKVPNRTFCSQTNFYLQLYWINTSNSLPNLFNKLEAERSLTSIYITRTTKLSTQLIQDFCEIYRIPFINMKSFGTKSMLCSLTRSVFKVMKNLLFEFDFSCVFQIVCSRIFLYAEHPSRFIILSEIQSSPSCNLYLR